MAHGHEITHRFIKTNGIKIHIAEQGSGPVLLLIHGFPELWYTWRHQIPALAKAGYHAVAPDMRGYGQTDAPEGVQKYTSVHLVGDLIGLLDELKVQQVFVTGHDWGALIAWDLCLLRPDRVKAVAGLSVPFHVREPVNETELMKKVLGEGFYWFRFQEPGRAEADFARYDTKTVLKKFMLLSKPDILVAPEDKEITDLLEVPKELPSWITEKELDYFAENFSCKGFTGPLNYYRAAVLSWELKAPWNKQKIYTPALFVTGQNDLVYHFPGYKDYIDKGGLAAALPNLKKKVVLESAHFMQEEKAHEINNLLINFFGEHR